jgi:hypothetical protein
MAMFRVGQKVVCVDDTGTFGICVKGRIYTVTRVMFGFTEQGVLLAEIAPPPEYPGFASRRFRPAVDRKTDIGFAHEILRKASKRAPVKSFENSSWFGG